MAIATTIKFVDVRKIGDRLTVGYDSQYDVAHNQLTEEITISIGRVSPNHIRLTRGEAVSIKNYLGDLITDLPKVDDVRRQVIATCQELSDIE